MVDKASVSNFVKLAEKDKDKLIKTATGTEKPLFNPNMWNGTKGNLGLPTSGYPDDSTVTISGVVSVDKESSPDGERQSQILKIRSLLPENFSESIATNWLDLNNEGWGVDSAREALLGLKKVEKVTSVVGKAFGNFLGGLYTKITGNKLEDDIAGGRRITMDLLGFGMLDNSFADFFAGSESMNLSIPLRFFKYADNVSAYESVYLPVRILMGMQLPGARSLTIDIPDYLTIRIGRLLKLSELVITNTNVDWGDRYEDGYPTTAHVSLSVKTAAVMFANDIAMQLKESLSTKPKPIEPKDVLKDFVTSLPELWKGG